MLFGSRPDMDAFVAANTLPDYLAAVILGSLIVVFIPVFIEYRAAGQNKDAWIVASSVINGCLLLIGVVLLLAMVFARPILQVTVPGLTAPTLDLAAQVALITWPAVLLTCVFSLLVGVYQAEGHFGLPAVVSFIGQLANLLLVLLLTPRWGVLGVAVAAFVNIALQVAGVSAIGRGADRYRARINWQHPGVRQVLILLAPLLLLGVFSRWTPVIDRFLLSGLPSGSIAHVNYAFKLVEVLAGLLSTGIAVVVFPRMVLNVSEKDLGGLRATVSLSLRLMWLAVAPAMTIGVALALPAVTLLLQRGQFLPEDSAAVAGLVRLYLLALVGMSLGTVTGRSFYALRQTRLVAQIGILQALIYVGYDALLVNRLGVVGIALAYTLYFNVSLLWQLLLIRRKTGAAGILITRSFIRTGAAAVIAGLAAFGLTLLTLPLWLQLTLALR